MSKEKISGSEALMRSLEHEGVKTLFGYPGGAIMPVFDALYDHRDRLNHILVRHEQGAAHAAQGFARVSGEVGVCLVTSGPGATNTITGIADAMIDSTPIVVIAGQVGAGLLGTDAFQEVDLVGVTQPISKWNYQIRRAEDVAWAVARAFYIARSGRPGPVVLDFAKNAQVDMTDYEPVNVDFIRSYDPDPETDSTAVAEAVALINAAKRPLVLVGQGVELGNAQKELQNFVEKADIPCGCTLLGLSALPSNHRLNKGMLGMHGNLGPNVKTNECDVLIAVGMRFDDRVTGKLETYAKQAKIIHLDVDPSEIGKNVAVDVPVLGNCKRTLSLLTELIQPQKHEEWIASFKPYEEKEFNQVIEKEVFPKEGPINMGEVVNAVSEATHNEAILVTDVGQNQMMACRYFKFTKPRSIVTSGGMGTMGFCLPAAIGATFGRPDRTVCAFMGDGGLQMTMQELGTVMEQKSPVKIILMNNNYLGNVRQWQAMFFNRRYSFTPMMNPDYMQIASAYGIASRRVMSREELNDGIQEMLSTDGPFLLEVCVVEEGNVLPMTPPGSSVNYMLMEC
ncbi:biosynthetic-type acetolactate synthase large subunit [Phocaeicola plebeius]|jgi:acetolactate synthase-1/2/3 large subunit|uniref:Acetolactate synthase n=1 Tax=Phocaeicola plebeius TaxID=310297 RepID=A0A414FLB9_9BACT|nr:biosynthetic-type acetolactate synthase large subunit [Phocaeicola plebeius]RHD49381.1 biosynthetic-type acetolactate synthase large subunit [Phocaeicola plebeius]